eukprot:103098_1
MESLLQELEVLQMPEDGELDEMVIVDEMDEMKTPQVQDASLPKGPRRAPPQKGPTRQDPPAYYGSDSFIGDGMNNANDAQVSAQVRAPSDVGKSYQDKPVATWAYSPEDYGDEDDEDEAKSRLAKQIESDDKVAKIAAKTGFEPDARYKGWINPKDIKRDDGYFWVTRFEGCHQSSKMFCHATHVKQSLWTKIGQIAPRIIEPRDRCPCGKGWWEMRCKDGRPVQVLVRSYAQVDRMRMNCKVIKILWGELTLELRCAQCEHAQYVSF